MRSLIMAFSMYSRLPMPRIKWDEKSERYLFCFFPFVGAAIGIIFLFAAWLMQALSFGDGAKGCILTVIPILVTGGIHMDGFLDTMDAKNSWKSREEKLQILKDPHIGAFACIYACVYFLHSVAFYMTCSFEGLFSVAFVFVLSRILSGLSVVTFPKAKRDGMVAESAKKSTASVKYILLAEMIVCIALMGRLNLRNAIIAGAVGLAFFLYYGWMSKKKFGGTTGDLAGYFLQTCELLCLIGIVLGERIALWF